MRLRTLQEHVAGRRVLYLDKRSLLLRLGLDAANIEMLPLFVGSVDSYLRRFECILFTNPESEVNRRLVAAAVRLDLGVVFCTDGLYEYSNVCSNPGIRRERPFGTFVQATHVAVRTYAEAVFFSLLGKAPLLLGTRP